MAKKQNKKIEKPAWEGHFCKECENGTFLN